MEVADSGDALPEGFQLGSYRIVSVLGRGGFGITYLAEDEFTGPVAIKEYHPTPFAVRGTDHMLRERTGSAQGAYDYDWGLKRFLEEARTLAQFRHSNIVRVRQVIPLNGTAYMVMDFEDGDSLFAWIGTSRTLDESRLMAILAPLLDGLECIHRAGYLHRDLTPNNVLIRPNGSPVIIDFGSARQVVEGATQALTAVATHGYSPPEQISGEEDAIKQGPWTDLYSLAATLYHLICGVRPLDSQARMSILHEKNVDPVETLAVIKAGAYSGSLLRAVDAALSIRTTDRPQSVAEFRQMLGAAIPTPASGTLHSQATLVRSEPDLQLSELDVAPIRPTPSTNAPTVPAQDFHPSEVHPDESALSTTKPPTARKTAPMTWVVGALVLVIVGLAGLLLFQSSDDEKPSVPLAPAGPVEVPTAAPPPVKPLAAPTAPTVPTTPSVAVRALEVLDRASVNLQGGRLSEALADYQEVIAFDADNESARVGIQQVVDRTLEAANQERQSGNPTTALRMLDSLSSATTLGERQRQALLRARGDANYDVAIGLENRGEHKSAADVFSRVVAGENTVDALQRSARLYDKAGMPKRAYEVLRDRLGGTSENAALLWLRAQLAKRLGHDADFERDTQRVLRLQPRNSQALTTYGAYLTARASSQTDYLEALTQVERTLAVRPYDDRFVHWRGQLLGRLGRYEEAVKVLEAIRPPGPTAEFAVDLIRSLTALGRSDAAAEVHSWAVQDWPEHRTSLDAALVSTR